MIAEAFVKRISRRRPNFIKVTTFQEGKQNPYSDNILRISTTQCSAIIFVQTVSILFFLLFFFNFVRNHKLTLCSTFTYLSLDEEHIVIGLGVSKNEKKNREKV